MAEDQNEQHSDLSPQQSPVCQDEDDSDADLPLPTCPLCLYDEVLPECASAVPSDNSYMRRILAIELHHSGLVPNDVVYTNIARHYNKHIHKP